MVKAVKILIGGALCATAVWPAAAISQPSTVLNNQVQLGDVFATQSLDVVDVINDTTLTTAASGNTFSGAVEGADLAVTSNQSLGGDVAATAGINALGRTGDVTIMSTAATGNDGESNVYYGAALTGVTNQVAGAVNVTALSDYGGEIGRTSSLTNNAQAVANSQGYGVVNGTADVTVNQGSTALTQADSGGQIQHTENTALFSATGISNNVTAVGTDYSTLTIRSNQVMGGPRTQASTFASGGSVQDMVGQSTATANNLSVNNEGPDLTVVSQQANTAYLRSEAVISAYEFGSSETNAYGVGNSVMAGNNGPSLTLDNTQVNSGAGVEVIAGYTGTHGYDAYLSATAIGNAVTGYACSQCQGRMTVTNNQANTADVGAHGTTSIGGARSVASVAAASGNSATFYVSSPGQ